MKRVKNVLLMCIAIFSIKVYGDIIITSYSPSKVLVKIDNLKDYPDIQVVGLGDYLTFSASNRVDMIDSSSYIDAFRITPIAFYAVKKNYLEKIDINETDWKKDKNVKKSDISIRPSVKSTKPNLESAEIHFSIAGFNKKSMVMYRSAQTIKYNDGRPDSVEHFDYEGDLSKLRKTF
jgi:hypothetical protein